MRARRLIADNSGFTLIEVLVAIVVLSIGVLGTVSLVDNANRATSTTKAREGALNLARDVIEAAHGINYLTITPPSADSVLQGIAGLEDSDPSTAGWQLRRRNIDYTVSTSVCLVDDPEDGVQATQPAGACTPAPAPTGKQDTNGPDYKRVTVTITWNERGTTQTLRQTTAVQRNYSGSAVDAGSFGPSPTGSWSSPMTNASLTSLGFAGTTTPPATNVKWSVNGTTQGDATMGANGAFSFTWTIGGCTASAPALDGTYFVRATPYDAYNSSAGPRAMTVMLNRCAPFALKYVNGGRDFLFGDNELLWPPSPEQDVVGYYVYKGSSIFGPWSPVTYSGPNNCLGLVKDTTCADGPDSTGYSYYAVAAVDYAPNGALRAGPKTPLFIDGTNNPPCWNAVKSNKKCIPPVTPPLSAGTTSDLQWSPALDIDGNGIKYYWIYRTAGVSATCNMTRDNRIDQVLGTDPLVWTDTTGVTGKYTYCVTAVDGKYAESPFSNPVTLTK